LGFDTLTETMPQLGTSTWWKVAGSVGICIRGGGSTVGGLKSTPEPVYEYQ